MKYFYNSSLMSLKFSTLSEERKGEIFIIAEAILWGLFPIFTFQSLSSIGALTSAGLSQFLSLIVITPFALRSKTLVNTLNKEVIKPVLYSCLLIGVVFYSLIFVAGKYEDPVTISILLLFEVPATYIVLLLFGKEKVRVKQVAGSFLVLIASVMVIYKEDFSFQLTSLLVVLAVFFAPMGNYYNKVAREHVSATVFMFVRGILSTLFILLLAICFEGFPAVSDIRDSLYFIIPNGILVFGISKIFWIEGIYRIEIGKAISLNSIFPIVTMIGSFILIGTLPSTNQVFALVPAIMGVYLLTKK